MKTQSFGRSMCPCPARGPFNHPHLVSTLSVLSLNNYRKNRENGIETDNPNTSFPSEGFDTLDINNSERLAEDKWPDQEGRHWWKLTLNDGRIVEDFYWTEDKARGFPDENDQSRYWFIVHHATSGTKMEGFSLEPNREKGYPNDGEYRRYVKYTECGPIKEWMEGKDKNFKARLQREKLEIILSNASEDFNTLAQSARGLEELKLLSFRKSADDNNNDKPLNKEEEKKLEIFVNAFEINTHIVKVKWSIATLSQNMANALIQLLRKLPHLEEIEWVSSSLSETQIRVASILRENQRRRLSGEPLTLNNGNFPYEPQVRDSRALLGLFYDDDPRKYNDDDITDYKEHIIKNTLGEFKVALNNQRCQFLLNEKFRDGDKEYFVAVTDAVDTVGAMLPIDYFFDKSHQISSPVVRALHVILPRLDNLEHHQDPILRAQLLEYLPERICDEGLRSNILQKLKDARFDREILEANMWEIEADSRTHDVFEEIIPEMLPINACYAKIIFPYNVTNVHWLSGEIKIKKVDHHYTVEVYAHDPYGGGQMLRDNFLRVQETITMRIQYEDPEARITCSNCVSQYTRRQQTGDGISCGIIVAEDIIKLIKCQSLNIDVVYHEYGALKLREQHVNAFECGTAVDLTQKRFSRRLEAAKKAIGVGYHTQTLAQANKRTVAKLNLKDKNEIITLISGLRNKDLKSCIFSTICNHDAYLEKDGSYITLVKSAVDERITVLQSEGQPVDYNDIVAVNAIQRLLFSNPGNVQADVEAIYQIGAELSGLRDVSRKERRFQSDRKQNYDAANISEKEEQTSFVPISSHEVSSVSIEGIPAKSEGTDLESHNSQSIGEESKERARLEQEKNNLNTKNEELKKRMDVLRTDIAEDEKMMLLSSNANGSTTIQDGLTDLQKRMFAFTGGEDKARESQRFAEKALQKKQRYQEFNLRFRIQQIEDMRLQVDKKAKLLEEEKNKLENNKNAVELKKAEHIKNQLKAKHEEDGQAQERNQRTNERAHRDAERAELGRQRAALQTEFENFNRDLAHEQAKVRSFTIATKSCGWHVNGYLDAYIKVNGHSLGTIRRGINIAIINKKTGESHGRFRDFDTCGSQAASRSAVDFIQSHYVPNDDLLVAISADEMSQYGGEIGAYLRGRFGANSPMPGDWRKAWCFIEGRGEVSSSPPYEYKIVSLDHPVDYVETVRIDVEGRRRNKKQDTDNKDQDLERQFKAKREEILKLDQAIIGINAKIENNRLTQQNEQKHIDEQEKILQRAKEEIRTKQEIIGTYQSLIAKYDTSLATLNTKLANVRRIDNDNNVIVDEVIIPAMSSNELEKISKQLKDNKENLVMYEKEMLDNLDELTKIEGKLRDVKAYLSQQAKLKEEERVRNETLRQERIVQEHVEKARKNTYTRLACLVNNYVLTGYDLSSLKTPVEKLIAALLANVLNKREPYYLGGASNSVLPSQVENHIDVIFKRVRQDLDVIEAGLVDKIKEIDSSTFNVIVDAVNEEFSSDGVRLDVTLLNNEEEVITRDVPQREGNCNIPVHLWLHEGNYLTRSHRQNVFSPYEYAHHLLVGLVLDDTDLFNALFYEEMNFRLKGNLQSCPVEQLLKSHTELDAKIACAKDFEKLRESILTESLQYENRAAQISANVLNRLFSYIKESKNMLEERQIIQLFEFTKSSMVNALLFTLQHEIERRKEEETTKLEQTDDPIKKLEKLIALKERELDALSLDVKTQTNKVEETENEVKKVKTDIERIHASYQLQKELIDNDIKKAEKEYNKLEKELKALESTAIKDQGKIDELEAEQEEIKKYLEKLKAQEKIIVAEYEAALNEKTAYEQDKNTVNGEIESINKEKTDVEQWKNEEKARLAVIKTLFHFAKAIHDRFKENKTVFAYRHDLLNRIQALQLSHDSSATRLGMLFDYLISLDGLNDLQDFGNGATPNGNLIPIRQAIPQCDMFLFDEILGIIYECVELPKIKWIHSENRCEVVGFNISTRDGFMQLKKSIESLVFSLGFSLNAQNKLVVSDGLNAGFRGFAHLPQRFAKLVNDRIEIKYLPINGSWHEKNLQGNDAKGVFENLEIDYFDVLKSYVDYIEVIAGNDIHVEENITLPGISLTLHAGKNIYTKDALEIDTSGKNGMSFIHSTARAGSDPIYRQKKRPYGLDIETRLAGVMNECQALIQLCAKFGADIRQGLEAQIRKSLEEQYGLDYREEGWPTGRVGDEGGDGLPGQNAGHICLKAGKEIEHIEQIRFKVKGGDGAAGQKGGVGDEGRVGCDAPDATVRDTSGIGRRQLNISWARIPGVDKEGREKPDELGGPGGDAGRAGLGGHRGIAGEILIEDARCDIRFQEDVSVVGDIGTKETLRKNILSGYGNNGDDAGISEGGLGGEPGRQGCDVELFKPSFWTTTKMRKGRLDPKIIENPEGGSRTFWDLDFSIFGTSVDRFGPSDFYRYQINVNGSGDEQPMIRSEYEVRNHERRNARARAGQSNRDRRKSEESRRKDIRVTNIAAQAAHQLYLGKKTRDLAKTERWDECQVRCEKKIARIEAEIRGYEARIQACEVQAQQKTQELQAIQEKLNEATAKVTQLEQTKNGIQQKIAAGIVTVTIADKQYAAKMEAIAELQENVSNARLAFESIKIDKESQEGLQKQFKVIYDNLAHAFGISQSIQEKALGQHRIAYLHAVESLKLAQAELAVLQAELDERVAEKDLAEKRRGQLEQILHLLKNMDKALTQHIIKAEEVQLLTDYKQGVKKEGIPGFNKNIEMSSDELSLMFPVIRRPIIGFSSDRDQALLIESANRLFRQKMDEITSRIEVDNGYETRAANDMLSRIELCLLCIVNDKAKGSREEIQSILASRNSNDYDYTSWHVEYLEYERRFKAKELRSIISTRSSAQEDCFDFSQLVLDVCYFSQDLSQLACLIRIYQSSDMEEKLSLLQYLIVTNYADVVMGFKQHCENKQIQDNLSSFFDYVKIEYAARGLQEADPIKFEQLDTLITISTIYYVDSNQKCLAGLYYLVKKYGDEVERLISMECSILSLAKGNFANFIEFVHHELKMSEFPTTEESVLLLLTLIKYVEKTRYEYEGFTRENTSVFDLSSKFITDGEKFFKQFNKKLSYYDTETRQMMATLFYRLYAQCLVGNKPWKDFSTFWSGLKDLKESLEIQIYCLTQADLENADNDFDDIADQRSLKTLLSNSFVEINREASDSDAKPVTLFKNFASGIIHKQPFKSVDGAVQFVNQYSRFIESGLDLKREEIEQLYVSLITITEIFEEKKEQNQLLLDAFIKVESVLESKYKQLIVKQFKFNLDDKQNAAIYNAMEDALNARIRSLRLNKRDIFARKNAFYNNLLTHQHFLRLSESDQTTILVYYLENTTVSIDEQREITSDLLDFLEEICARSKASWEVYLEKVLLELFIRSAEAESDIEKIENLSDLSSNLYRYAERFVEFMASVVKYAFKSHLLGDEATHQPITIEHSILKIIKSEYVNLFKAKYSQILQIDNTNEGQYKQLLNAAKELQNAFLGRPLVLADITLLEQHIIPVLSSIIKQTKLSMADIFDCLTRLNLPIEDNQRILFKALASSIAWEKIGFESTEGSLLTDFALLRKRIALFAQHNYQLDTIVGFSNEASRNTFIIEIENNVLKQQLRSSVNAIDLLKEKHSATTGINDVCDAYKNILVLLSQSMMDVSEIYQALSLLNAEIVSLKEMLEGYSLRLMNALPHGDKTQVRMGQICIDDQTRQYVLRNYAGQIYEGVIPETIQLVNLSRKLSEIDFVNSILSVTSEVGKTRISHQNLDTVNVQSHLNTMLKTRSEIVNKQKQYLVTLLNESFSRSESSIYIVVFDYIIHCLNSPDKIIHSLSKGLLKQFLICFEFEMAAGLMVFTPSQAAKIEKCTFYLNETLLQIQQENVTVFSWQLELSDFSRKMQELMQIYYFSDLEKKFITLSSDLGRIRQTFHSLDDEKSKYEKTVEGLASNDLRDNKLQFIKLLLAHLAYYQPNYSPTNAQRTEATLVYLVNSEAIKALSQSHLFVDSTSLSKKGLTHAIKHLREVIQKHTFVLNREQVSLFLSDVFSAWEDAMDLAMNDLTKEEWPKLLDTFIKDSIRFLQQVFFDDEDKQSRLAKFSEEVAKSARILERLNRKSTKLPLLDQLVEKLNMAAYKENGYYFAPMMCEQFINSLGLNEPHQYLNKIKDACALSLPNLFASINTYNEPNTTASAFVEQLKLQLSAMVTARGSEVGYTNIVELFKNEQAKIQAVEGLTLEEDKFLLKILSRFESTRNNDKVFARLLLKKVLLNLQEKMINKISLKVLSEFTEKLCALHWDLYDRYFDAIALILVNRYRNESIQLSLQDHAKDIASRVEEGNLLAATNLSIKQQLFYYYHLHTCLEKKADFDKQGFDAENVLHGLALKLAENALNANEVMIESMVCNVLNKQSKNSVIEQSQAKVLIVLLPFLRKDLLSVKKVNFNQLLEMKVVNGMELGEQQFAIQIAYLTIRSLCREVLSDKGTSLVLNRLMRYVDSLFINIKSILATLDLEESSMRDLKPELERLLSQTVDISQCLLNYRGNKDSELLKEIVLYSKNHDELDRLLTEREFNYAKRLLSKEDVLNILLNKSANIWEESLKAIYWEEIENRFFIDKLVFREDEEKWGELEDLLNQDDFAYISNFLQELYGTAHIEKAIFFTKKIIERIELIQHSDKAFSKNTLLDNLRSEVEKVNDFKLQFMFFYSMAIEKNALSTWLECIDYFDKKRERFTLAEINHILSALQSFDDLNVALALVRKTPDNRLVHTLLSCQLNKAILTAIPESDELDEFLRSDLVFDTVLFQSKVGCCCLSMLSDVLVATAREGIKSVRLAEFKLLSNYLVKTKAYQDEELLLKLKSKPITYWSVFLKRELMYQSLSLHTNNHLHGDIVDCLIRIEKEKGEALVLKLIALVKKLELPKRNLHQFLPIVRRLASNRWQITLESMGELEKANNFQDWATILTRLNDNKKNNVKQRSITEIVEILLNDKTEINEGIKDLIHKGIEKEIFDNKLQVKGSLLTYDKFSGKSILELRIAQVEERYSLFEHFEKSDIQQWAEVFKGLGSDKFRNTQSIVDFLAIMIRAVELTHENNKPRYTQLAAMLCFLDGMEKHIGRLANISTGEGKSLITRMLAIARALNGEKVDILTSSKVLAVRDAEEAKPLLELFGISVGNNCDPAAEENEQVRKSRYRDCQVVYGETGAFQRDFLLSKYMENDIRPEFLGNSLIVDEVDSMFIDNAERILYISHSIEDLANLRELFMIIWSAVQNPEANTHTVKNVEKVVEFIKKQLEENAIKIPGGFVMNEFINRRLKTWVENAYTARDLEEGDQYVSAVAGEKKGQAVVMDLYTGVEQLNTQWSNGLQQFVQIKHFNRLTDESLKAIFMSNMTFFKSYYSNINGMTGTLGAIGERRFLADTYGLDFFKLPRFREERYIQERGVIEPSIERWIHAILKEVAEKMENHREIDSSEIVEARNYIENTIPDELKKLKIQIEEKFNKIFNENELSAASSEEAIQTFQSALDRLVKSAKEKDDTKIEEIKCEIQEVEEKLTHQLTQKILKQDEYDARTHQLESSIIHLQSLIDEAEHPILMNEAEQPNPSLRTIKTELESLIDKINRRTLDYTTRLAQQLLSFVGLEDTLNEEQLAEKCKLQTNKAMLESLVIGKADILQEVEELSVHKQMIQCDAQIHSMTQSIETFFTCEALYKKVFSDLQNNADHNAVEQDWGSYLNEKIQIDQRISGLRKAWEEVRKSILPLENKRNQVEENLKQHRETMSETRARQERERLLEMKKAKVDELTNHTVEMSSKDALVEKTKRELSNLSLELRGNIGIIENTNQAERAVLIICANQMSVKLLHKALKPLYREKVYKYDSSLEKLAIEKVGPGNIIVATNIAGRGMDLETTTLLEKNGGLHVILSYLPGNVRVEAQAFGRTARKGNEGTGKYIVCDHRVAAIPQMSVEYLCDERDEREAARLDTIIRTKLPRIILEEKLFNRFAELQSIMRGKLREAKFTEVFVQLQIKSLQDRWAFWLDRHTNEIDAVYKDGDSQVLQLYAEFEALAKHDLSKDQYGLIESSGELHKLAKSYIVKGHNKENYAAAEQCYDKIITQDPHFSAFAHYYKVMCIFGQGSTFGDKQKARQSLKAAIRLFEDNLARLSTCLQIVKVLGDQKQKEGQGRESDFFSQHITNHMCFINVHLEAAKEALGRDLSVKSFTTGTMVGADSERFFANVRKSSGIVKDNRISRQLTFKWEILIPQSVDWMSMSLSDSLKNNLCSSSGNSFVSDHLSDQDVQTLKQAGIGVQRIIFRKNERVKLSSQFFNNNDNIVQMLSEEMILRKNSEQKTINFEQFGQFILTKQTFKDYLDGLIGTFTVYKLHKDYKQNALGGRFWENDVFKHCGFEIKQALLAMNNPINKRVLDELISTHLKMEDRNPENVQAIYTTLKGVILSEEPSYGFNENAKTQIKEVIETIVFRANLQTQSIEQLPLHRYGAVGKKKAEEIKRKLLASFINQETEQKWRYQALGLTEKEFHLVWNVLNQHQMLSVDILKTLNIKDKVNPLHASDVEQAILSLYEKNHFDESDIPFPDDLAKELQALWSQLRDQKVVKDPAVRFSLNRDPEQVFDAIKVSIEENLHNLFEGTSFLKKEQKFNEEQITITDKDKLIEGIHKALEAAIGKIKFLPKLKLSEKVIQDYFKEGKMPPEIVDYTRRCCVDVLSLVKDASWFSWDAFACAMLGIIQIVAGAILCYLGMSFIGQILIREGIGDIVFAVQSSIAGDFSWKAYGEHKLVSLAISIATVGLGSLASAAQVGSQTIDQGTRTAYVLGKLTESAVDVSISVGVNLLTSELVNLASTSIFDGLLNDFSRMVEQNKEIIEKKQELLHQFEELSKKFGIEDSNAIVNQRISDLNLAQKIEGQFSSHVMKYTQMVTQELSKRKDLVGTIAKAVGTVLSYAGPVRVISEMVSSTKGILEDLINGLKKYESINPKKDVEAVNAKMAKNFAKTKQEDVSKAIISQIRSCIQAMLLRPAAQLGVKLAVDAATESVRKELVEGIHALAETLDGSSKLDNMRAIIAHGKEPNNVATTAGDFAENVLLNIEQIQGIVGEVVIDGHRLSLESVAKLYGEVAHFIQHENAFHMIAPDFRQALSAIQDGATGGVFELKMLATAVQSTLTILDGATMLPHTLMPDSILPFGNIIEGGLTIALEGGHYIPCEQDASGVWHKVDSGNGTGHAAQAILYASRCLSGGDIGANEMSLFLDNAIQLTERSFEAKSFYYSGGRDGGMDASLQTDLGTVRDATIGQMGEWIKYEIDQHARSVPIFKSKTYGLLGKSHQSIKHEIRQQNIAAAKVLGDYANTAVKFSYSLGQFLFNPSLDTVVDIGMGMAVEKGFSITGGLISNLGFKATGAFITGGASVIIPGLLATTSVNNNKIQVLMDTPIPACSMDSATTQIYDTGDRSIGSDGLVSIRRHYACTPQTTKLASPRESTSTIQDPSYSYHSSQRFWNSVYSVTRPRYEADWRSRATESWRQDEQNRSYR